MKMNKRKCPECGNSLHWDRNDGLICSGCGLIVQQSYYSGRELVI